MKHTSEMIILVVTAKLGSLSAAAKKLDLSTAAVSKAITRLEKHLGTKLFHRSTRKISLTDAGVALYQKCLPIHEAFERAEEEVFKLAGRVKKRIIISSSPNFSYFVLAPVLTEFLKEHKDVHFDIEVDNSTELPKDRIFDLVFRHDKVPYFNHKPEKICEVHWQLVATTEYLAKCGEPKTAKELEEHNCLDYAGRNSGRVWRLYKNGKEYLINTRGSIDSNNLNFIHQTMLLGAGITLAAKPLIVDALANGKVKTILPEYQIKPTVFWVFHSDEISKEVEQFLDYLKAYLKEWRERL